MRHIHLLQKIRNITLVGKLVITTPAVEVEARREGDVTSEVMVDDAAKSEAHLHAFVVCRR